MKQRVAALLVTSFACAFIPVGVANAQFGREGVWMTDGGNAQRSSWVRTDAKITKSSIVSGFQFLWKVPLAPKEPNVLTEPLIMDRYIGYQGFRSLALMGGADSIYAVDTDLNRIEWQKHISTDAAQNASSGCPAAASMNVTLPTTAEFPSGLPAFGAFGRRGPAKSGVGEPYRGAVTLKEAQAVRSVPGAAPRAFPRVRDPIVVYALTTDGMFHTMYVSNGDEFQPPVKFVPPNAAPRGLIVVNKVAYAVTGSDCGGASGVWALDLTTKEVASWTGDGARMAGSEGAALGPDGTLYVATAAGDSTYSSSVVALEAKTLKLKDWYTAPGEQFTSSPVVFQYRNKVLVAALSKDGRLHLLNTASLGGPDHRTPLYETPASSDSRNFVAGALASWQDAEFTVWLLASTGNPVKDFTNAGGSVTNGGVVAWKVVDQNGAPAVEPGWISRNMTSPMPPTIINGVVLTAASAGAPASSSHAILYALDGATGKELWNSGKTITSSAEGGGIAAGGAQVYVTTRDGKLYAFGFYMER